MIRTAAILILFASPALAADPECYDTRQVPPPPFVVKPPRDGSPIRQAKPGPEFEAYQRWLTEARRRHDARWITQRVRVECPAHQATPWPARQARWEPGGVVYIPHPDYPPDARPWDRTPRDSVPVPAPGAWAVVGGFLLLISARARRRGKVGGEYYGH